MKVRISIATALIVLGALVHTIAGEFMDIKLLMLSDIPTNIKFEIRVSWYIVAIDFFVSGIYLISYLIKNKLEENSNLIEFMAVRFLLYGIVIFLVLIIKDPSQIFIVPQWILLITIGILLGWNSMSQSKKKR